MKRSPEIEVSIVIPNWNGLGIIDRCLSSIFDHPQGVSFEVIVVDNGSSDDSVDTIRRRFPLATIACRAFNSGFARACNAGMRLARGRYIWVLNADTEISVNALKAMVAFMEAHPEVGALNPRVIYPDGALQPAVRRVPTLRVRCGKKCSGGHLYTGSLAETGSTRPGSPISTTTMWLRWSGFVVHACS